MTDMSINLMLLRARHTNDIAFIIFVCKKADVVHGPSFERDLACEDVSILYASSGRCSYLV